MRRRPHIVMVSWRGPEHPGRGGAERYTACALQGLAQRGARVTWLVADPGKGIPVEPCEGIEIVRAGRGFGHVWEAARYLRAHGGETDLVIDQINGYPMLTPLSFPGPRLVLIHQLARQVLFRHLPWPAAAVAYALETPMLKAYAQHPAITVSPSTAHDLSELGFTDVHVVRNAVQAPPNALASTPRRPPERPTFVALGRLVPGKRFEHALDAFEIVKQACPKAQLVVMGRGDGLYARRLEQRCERMAGVRLVADASEREKWRLLAGATALVATSVREGWGIMASEAHAVGTPVIAYDVPGLRDSTDSGCNGLVCPPRPQAAAAAMARLAADGDLWQELSEGARAGAAALAPERLQAEFAGVVDGALRRAGRPALPTASEAGAG